MGYQMQSKTPVVCTTCFSQIRNVKEKDLFLQDLLEIQCSKCLGEEGLNVGDWSEFIKRSKVFIIHSVNCASSQRADNPS